MQQQYNPYSTNNNNDLNVNTGWENNVIINTLSNGFEKTILQESFFRLQISENSTEICTGCSVNKYHIFLVGKYFMLFFPYTATVLRILRTTTV